MVLKKRSLCGHGIILSIAVLLSACSNSNNKTTDTYENINRKVYAFNNGIDKVLLKPTAKAYKAITPKFIDKSIGNVFSNLDDVGNIINNTLQGKFPAAAEDTGRFLFNSTLGLAGLLDIASAAGFKKSDEDFGQTLAKWGVKSGPYVMLPLLGPSTLRDASAKLTVDRLTDPTNYHDDSLAFTAVDVVKKRSDLFAQEEVLKGFSDDQYSALRDVWLQNRAFLIRDGKRDTNAEADLIDELEMLDAE